MKAKQSSAFKTCCASSDLIEYGIEYFTIRMHFTLGMALYMTDTLSTLQRIEKFLGYGIVLSTPFVISPVTVDSYLMPKYVWLALWSALWLFLIFIQTDFKAWRPAAVDYPLAALLLVSLVSILIDFQSALQLRAFLHLAMFIGLFYAYRRFWGTFGSPAVAVGILMLVCSLLSLYGILQDYGYDFIGKSGGVRDWRAQVVATIGNPNFLSGFLLICLPVILAFGLRKETSPLQFLLTALTGFIITLCHTLTFCVGSTIGISGTILVLLITTVALCKRWSFSLSRLMILLACIAAAAGWYLADNPYNSHGCSLYSEACSHRNGGQEPARQFNWRTTRVMINENPLTGIGFGNYLSKHLHYQGINYELQGRPHDRDYVIPVDQPHFQILKPPRRPDPGVLVILWLFIAWNKRVLRHTTEA